MDMLESRTMLAHGLTGTYFQDPSFDKPLAVNIDSRISFGPFRESQAPLDGRQSARWTGLAVAKFSEYYTFYVQTNGSARLWVNNKLLIEEPANSQPHEFAGKMKVKFIAGQTYNVRLDYVDRHGDEGYVRLLWSSTRTPKQVMPSTRLRSAMRMPPKLQISFRPTGAEPVGSYRVDNGLAYGVRGQGYTYGWDQDNTSGMFDRDSTRSHSERYDAGAHMQPSGQNRTWRIRVPNGTYNVRVIAGDPSATDSSYSIDVDGQRVIRGNANQFSYWFDGSTTIDVNDGNISLTNGVGAINNKINFVEISPTRENDRFIAFVQIGYTSSNAAHRHVNDNLLNGWKPWVLQSVDPIVDRGYTRIQLHNPFGTGDYMELDQYLRAKEAGLNWLTDDFVEAFKPYTSKGIEIIAYIGLDKGDVTFGTTTEQWFQRFWGSVQPMIDAGVSIALDSACLQPEQSNLYAAAQMLRAMDVKVYIESRQMQSYPQWANFGVFSEESWWHDSDPETNPDAGSWALPDDRITGEIIRWVHYPPSGYDFEDPGWRIPQVQDVLRDEHTVAVQPLLHVDNVDVYWVLARANGYIGAIA
jgi:hypothetical protein